MKGVFLGEYVKKQSKLPQFMDALTIEFSNIPVTLISQTY